MLRHNTVVHIILLIVNIKTERTTQHWTTQDYRKLLTAYYYRTQNAEYRATWQRCTVQRCTMNNRHVQTKTQTHVNRLSRKMSNSPITTRSIIQNTLCPKKVDHQLMVITLSKPYQFSKILSTLERGVNCKQDSRRNESAKRVSDVLSIRAISIHTVIDVTLYVIHRIFSRQNI